MAKLFPDVLPTRPHDGGLNTELEVLRALELELPDAYSLFHSVGWTQTEGSQEKHGEADIVVVNQAGDILVIEVKAGAVVVEQGEVFKAYRGERKSVSAQVSRTYHALRKRLGAANIKPEIHTLLVLPHARVNGTTLASPRERIVDSSQIDDLPRTVREILTVGLPAPDLRERVEWFLSELLEVEPDVSALTGQLAEHTTRLSVSAGVILTHCAEVKLTHLGEDGGFARAVDVDPGASGGDTSDGPQGRRYTGDCQAAGLLAQHGQALLA